jgi:DNA polymerase-1
MMKIKPKAPLFKSEGIPAWGMQGKQFDDFLVSMSMADNVAVDTESNAEDLRDGTGFVLGVSVSFRVGGSEPHRVYFPVNHGDENYDKESIDRLFEELYKHTLIFHNAKHDLVALEVLGYKFTGKFYDTMLMVHMIDENLPSKALDYTSRHYLGAEFHKERSAEMQAWIDLFGWGQLPAKMTEEYASHDAYLTLLLWERLFSKFKKDVTEEGWEFEQEFIRTIIDIEGRGILVDVDFVEREINRGTHTMNDLVDTLGFVPSGNDLVSYLLDDLKLPVLKKTAKGNPSFDKEAMEQYEHLLEQRNDASAQYVLVYRGWQKTISASYRGFLNYLSSDGRLRANYKIHGTRTGRLSCEKPNLQQIPRSSSKDWNGGLKRAFIAAPGFRLIDFDYGQLELRLGAAYAHESKLITVFAENRDVFQEMSNETGMPRQDCKTLNYTIQFGGGVNRIATVFGVTAAEAQEILEKYYARYPRIRAAAKKAELIVKQKGKIQVWSGRYRHFTKAEQRTKAYKAFNAMIQGGAADIVKRQIVKVNKALDPEVARIVLTVHDSIVVEIREDKVDELVPQIKEMLADVKPNFGVKFAVDAKEWGS